MNGRRQFIQQLLGLSSLLTLSACGSALRPTPSKTGVVLDPLFFEHTRPDHPESAKRLMAIDNILQEHNLWASLTPVKARKATQDELLWAHTPNYIKEIQILSDAGTDFYDENQDTYLTPASYDAACMAAGGAIALNLAVYDRQVDNGFALLRPPGHHALADKAMGFCLFNSDVIAARALQKYRGVERVAIIDFDVHHGNGTQDLTLNDPSIMAMSIHQHPFWPMTGDAQHLGEGTALGTNINCPLGALAGDDAYLQALEEIIIPKLRQFKPQHIIVFAGYDGHWQDHLAQHILTVDGYNQLVAKLKAAAAEICGGRISLSLGGGYNLRALAPCALGSFEVLLGITPTTDKLGKGPLKQRDTDQEMAELKQIHGLS